MGTLNKKGACILIIGCALAATASAQVVTTLPGVLNPRVLQFTASPDHNAVISGGGVVPDVVVLDHYEVNITPLLPNPGALVQTLVIGKPTPDANGLIVVTLSAFPQLGTLTHNIFYVARVVAITTNGKLPNASDPSNPFAWPDAARAGGIPTVK